MQIFLEGLTRCANLPILPFSLIQTIGEEYDPFHVSFLQEEVCKDQKEGSLSEWRDLLVRSLTKNEK